MACDFRFQKDALKGLNYAVCGLGNSLYAENFNKVAIDLDKSFASLDAHRILPLECCDENTLKSRHSSLEGDFDHWSNEFIKSVESFVKSKKSGGMNGCCGGSGKDAACDCGENETVNS